MRRLEIRYLPRSWYWLPYLAIGRSHIQTQAHSLALVTEPVVVAPSVVFHSHPVTCRGLKVIGGDVSILITWHWLFLQGTSRFLSRYQSGVWWAAAVWIECWRLHDPFMVNARCQQRISVMRDMACRAIWEKGIIRRLIRGSRRKLTYAARHCPADA